MRIFLAGFGVLAVLFFGTPSASAADTDAMLTNYVDSLNANMPPNLDGQAVSELFSQNAVQSHPGGEPPDGPHEGRKALEAFFSTFDQRWDTWMHTEARRVVQGNQAFWQGTAGGIRKDSGKEVEVPFAFFATFADDGLVEEMNVYINVQQIADQLK